MRLSVSCALLAFFLCIDTFAQDTNFLTQNYLALNPHFTQIKDQFNYGLVFHGAGFSFEYKHEVYTHSGMWMYEADLGFSVFYNKGIAFNWRIKPVDACWAWRIKTNRNPMYLGPYVSAQYQWQLYPELQSGHMNWYSSFELGPVFIYDFKVMSQAIQIIFKNSFVGGVSRPTYQTESHFYSLEFKDFVSNPHTNMTFGSFNLFNHTQFDAVFLRDKKLNLGYSFEYFGYFSEPTVHVITHALILKWKLGR